MNFTNQNVIFKVGSNKFNINNHLTTYTDSYFILDGSLYFSLETLNEIVGGIVETRENKVIIRTNDKNLKPDFPFFFPSQGHAHDLDLVNTFQYSSWPPTSGPHEEKFPESYIEKLDKATLIHLLEHGNVVIAYDPIKVNNTDLDKIILWVKNENVNEYSNFYAENGQSIFLTPWENLDYPFVLLAWTRYFPLTHLNQNQIQRFILSWLGNKKNTAQ